mmetsp:Transcript_72886/g.196472  ORF Transcript_72886/g.196472 Transcript_72886/m.196472 type:complete len:330 (+) Transcript_72886:3-992(+)
MHMAQVCVQHQCRAILARGLGLSPLCLQRTPQQVPHVGRAGPQKQRAAEQPLGQRHGGRPAAPQSCVNAVGYARALQACAEKPVHLLPLPGSRGCRTHGADSHSVGQALAEERPACELRMHVVEGLRSQSRPDETRMRGGAPMDAPLPLGTLSHDGAAAMRGARVRRHAALEVLAWEYVDAQGLRPAVLGQESSQHPGPSATAGIVPAVGAAATEGSLNSPPPERMSRWRGHEAILDVHAEILRAALNEACQTFGQLSVERLARLVVQVRIDAAMAVQHATSPDVGSLDPPWQCQEGLHVLGKGLTHALCEVLIGPQSVPKAFPTWEPP